MRSSSTQLAQRINGALLVLRRLRSSTKAVAALVRRYGVSKRQAFRYVREAQRVRLGISLNSAIHFGGIPVTHFGAFRPGGHRSEATLGFLY